MYISDGCCTEFNIITSYVYSKLSKILFSKIIMLIESGILWKTILVVIYAKILHHSFVPTTSENFKSIFYLSCTKENLKICVPVWFEQLRE